MSIELNDNIKPKAPKILDDRYSMNGVTPYTDVAQANASIPLSYRALGLPVLIGNVEYWYKDGITDLDLVPKGGSGGGHIIQQDGVSLPTQPKLNVKGGSLLASDDAPNSRTNLEFTGNVCTLNMEQDVVFGTATDFVHTDGGTEVDTISAGLNITRANAGWLYNPPTDPFSWANSPSNSVWYHFNSYSDFYNLNSLPYTTFYNAVNGSVGFGGLNDTNWIMKDTSTGFYWLIDMITYNPDGVVGQYAYNFLQWDGATPITDGTVVTLGARTYTYNLASNNWTNLEAGTFTTITDCINNDTLAEVVATYDLAIYNFVQVTSKVIGVAGNLIVSTIAPIQSPAFYFAYGDVLQGGTDAIAGGGFHYQRLQIISFCDGAIHFADGTFMNTKPTATDFKKIILVDQIYGDDATAVAYNQLLPYKTIDVANAHSVSGDLIYINPSPNPYFATSLLCGRNYYVSGGATVTNCAINGTTFGQGDVNVYGDGNLQLTAGINTSGGYDGRITLECEDMTTNGAFVTGGAGSSIYIRVRGTMIVNGYFYLQNDTWWATAIEPLDFQIIANKVILNAILFVIYQPQWQLNINVLNYSSWSLPVPEIWSAGGVPSAFKVASYIHIGSANIDRTAAYSQPLFNFVGGGNLTTTFISGVYNYTGRGVDGDRNILLLFDGNCQQNVFFDGVAYITKGAFFVELSGGGSTFGYLKIKGKVYVDNSLIASALYLYSAYFVCQAKVCIEADTIANSPKNHILQIGDYSGSLPIAQVDVNDCQLVNTDGSGTAPAAVLKNNTLVAPWGTLRLKNVKIVTSGATSIEGSGSTPEPVDIYSVYTNKPQVNIANTIAGTVIITDVNVTSNNE